MIVVSNIIQSAIYVRLITNAISSVLPLRFVLLICRVIEKKNLRRSFVICACVLKQTSKNEDAPSYDFSSRFSLSTLHSFSEENQSHVDHCNVHLVASD